MNNSARVGPRIIGKITVTIKRANGASLQAHEGVLNPLTLSWRRVDVDGEAPPAETS